ncbi:hypothetical protein [Xylella taiwanensis]|uniref:hypothetical protein n=1 Tax=Xylella taiwanensis TaxID=1444770 RepID=UPI001E56D160|nr:hypothetical protein [Xylella taiwanensis]MCD8466159.1 hypothetical protein [Xylella taiwanensis]
MAALLSAPYVDVARKKLSKTQASSIAVACSNFYSFVNAACLKNHPVPHIGAITVLGELSDRV